MRDITLIVKPTHRCNLACPYCYDRINRGSWGDMTLDTVRKTAELFKGRVREWIWHGGEPMLMGVDWLREASNIIRGIDDNVRIEIQTNGTLIDEKAVEFFKEFGIRPGLSFDGIKNELTRKDTGRLMHVFKMLEEAGITFGVIQVIMPENVEQIIDEYEYFKRLNVEVQMNFEFHAHSNEQSRNVDAERMAEGILRFFDYWIMDKNNPRPSLLLEVWLGRLIGYGMSFCEHSSCVGRWFGIHPDGTLMPCGRDWTKEVYFGNVHDYSDVKEIYEHENYKRFVEQERAKQEYCRPCPFYEECMGGCPGKSWDYWGKFDMPAEDTCMATKLIFTGLFNRLKELDIEEEPEKYNPIFLSFLAKAGYRSVKLIRELEGGK